MKKCLIHFYEFAQVFTFYWALETQFFKTRNYFWIITKFFSFQSSISAVLRKIHFINDENFVIIQKCFSTKIFEFLTKLVFSAIFLSPSEYSLATYRSKMATKPVNLIGLTSILRIILFFVFEALQFFFHSIFFLLFFQFFFLQFCLHFLELELQISVHFRTTKVLRKLGHYRQNVLVETLVQYVQLGRRFAFHVEPPIARQGHLTEYCSVRTQKR